MDLFSGNISISTPTLRPPFPNIYDSAPSAKPNLTGLERPKPYTSKGVGSAIPETQLGYVSTLTSDSTTSTRHTDVDSSDLLSTSNTFSASSGQSTSTNTGVTAQGKTSVDEQAHSTISADARTNYYISKAICSSVLLALFGPVLFL